MCLNINKMALFNFLRWVALSVGIYFVVIVRTYRFEPYATVETSIEWVQRKVASSLPFANETVFFHYLSNNSYVCDDNRVELLLMVVCRPNDFQAREVVRRLWLAPFIHSPRTAVLFVVGRPKNTNESGNYSRDVVVTDVLDTYRNLSLKTGALLNWPRTFCPQRRLWLAKLDMDTIVRFAEFMTFFESVKQRKNSIYGYPMLNRRAIRNASSKWYTGQDVYPLSRFPAYASGSLYLMSPDVAENLRSVSPMFRRVDIEDVFYTGILRKAANVQLITHKRFIVYYDKDPCQWHRDALSTSVGWKWRNVRSVWRRYYTDCLDSNQWTKHHFLSGLQTNRTL